MLLDTLFQLTYTHMNKGNSVYPNRMPWFAAPHLGLHCLFTSNTLIDLLFVITGDFNILR